MKCFDCIVVGFGGVGSAALRECAKRGWSVLGIDRFGPAHTMGSSHGQTRMIRRAYFEHPDYVPIVQRAFEMWDELNRRHRTSPDIKELFTASGVLQIGHPDSQVIRGIEASARQHGLEIEEFSAAEIHRRLPLLKIPGDQVGLFEPDAGILRVELCVTAMVSQAIKFGAEIVSDTVVENWSVSDAGEVEVETDRGSYRSKRLIIAGGAWSERLLPGIDLQLRVLKKQQQWFQIDRVDQKLVNEFPAFLVEQADGSCYYGLPELDYLGMKICEHSGGVEIKNGEHLDRSLDQDELTRVEGFMKSYMNIGYHRLVHHSACMYTTTPDGHFVIDRFPDLKQVVFAAGLSGHGFKFAPVIGRHLVELLEGQDDPEFEFLKIRR